MAQASASKYATVLRRNAGTTVATTKSATKTTKSTAKGVTARTSLVGSPLKTMAKAHLKQVSANPVTMQSYLTVKQKTALMAKKSPRAA